MATPTQLSLYNMALTRHLGQGKLLSLTENNKSRRALDACYVAVLDECLEQGYWKHARKDVPLTGVDMTNSDFSPADFGLDFVNTSGFSYAFRLDVDYADCLQFYILSLTEERSVPFNDYKFANGIILANVDMLYMTYISNHVSYGLNYALWSPVFSRWVGCALAESICYEITQDKSLVEIIEKRAKRYKREALSRDFMEGPTQRLPQGSWVMSRFRGGLDSRDRRIY